MAPQYATYPSLRDKVVLITGGAEGIGAAAIEAFAAQGSQTIILDISEPSSKKLTEKIRAAGHPVPEFYQCDVTDLDVLKSVAEDVLKKYGTVNVVVNNAASVIFPLSLQHVRYSLTFHRLAVFLGKVQWR